MNCFLFSGLDGKTAEAVNALLGEPCSIKKGSELYRTGSIGILDSGSAVVRRKGETGVSVTMRNLTDGDLFGAASVFGKWQENFSSITSSKDCKVFYIDEKQFKALLAHYPPIALNYIAFLTDRIRFLNRRIDAFAAGSTSHRVFEYLVSVSYGNGIAGQDISNAELARRLKISRSSLYRSFDALEKDGFIKRENNKIFIKETD